MNYYIPGTFLEFDSIEEVVRFFNALPFHWKFSFCCETVYYRGMPAFFIRDDCYCGEHPVYNFTLVRCI